jgi:hypothetical protein
LAAAIMDTLNKKEKDDGAATGAIIIAATRC